MAVWLDLARLAMDMSYPSRAIEYATSAVRLDPKYPDAYCVRRQAHLARSDFGQAFNDFAKALRPELSEALRWQVLLNLAESAMWARIPRKLRACSLPRPESEDAGGDDYSLAVSHVLNSRYVEALRHFGEAMKHRGFPDGYRPRIDALCRRIREHMLVSLVGRKW